MESDGRLKLIIVGLVLAAFAIGYFVIAQGVQKSKNSSDTVQVSSAPLPVSSPSPTPSTVPGQNNLEEVPTLPKTGFPLPLVGAFATSAIISGWFLRRFPK